MGSQSKARQQRQRERSGGWKPLERAVPYITPLKREIMISEHMKTLEGVGVEMTREEAASIVDSHVNQECWKNDVYTVFVDRSPTTSPGAPPMIHLSIKRNDREVPGPERWRDFQRIKNEIVGAEHEAAELYPAESRVVDTANQFHLWAVAVPGLVFPFGFTTGLKLDSDDAALAKQRAF